MEGIVAALCIELAAVRGSGGGGGDIEGRGQDRFRR